MSQPDVGLDELVEVDAIEIKDAAKMISKHEIIPQLDNSFYMIRIALF